MKRLAIAAAMVMVMVSAASAGRYHRYHYHSDPALQEEIDRLKSRLRSAQAECEIDKATLEPSSKPVSNFTTTVEIAFRQYSDDRDREYAVSTGPYPATPRPEPVHQKKLPAQKALIWIIPPVGALAAVVGLWAMGVRRRSV